MRARSFLPTVSMGCSAPSTRMRSNSPRPRARLVDPLAGERPGLHIGQDFLHRRARRLAHDPRTAHVVAVLRRVADLAPHPRDAVRVGQIHDQLELVQALEVGEGRIVAGLHQRLESGLHQRGEATAQHRLLPEQVGLGLRREGRLEDARARASQPRRVRPGELRRAAAGVLVHPVQRRHAASGHELLAHPVPRGLGSDEDHVRVAGRDDLVVVHVEAVGEDERVARVQVPLDLGLVHVALDRVGNENRDDRGPGGGLGDGGHLEPVGPRPFRGGASLVETHHHIGARIPQVQGVRVPLAAVADDGHGSPLKKLGGGPVAPHRRLAHLPVSSSLRATARAFGECEGGVGKTDPVPLRATCRPGPPACRWPAASRSRPPLP